MYIGIAVVIVDVLQIPTGNAGGHLAHIGGCSTWAIFMPSNCKMEKILGVDFERLWKWLSHSFYRST